MTQTHQILRNPKTGQSIRFVSTGRDTAGQLLHMEATYRAHSTEPAAHYHPHQVEDFTVLAGELTVQIHGQTRTLQPGDTLHVPQNTVHSMWNASDTETRLDWQIRPALDTEVFFRTTFGLAADGRTGPDGMPPFLQTVLLARHFSSVFRLAKPPRLVQQLIFGALSPIAYLAGYRPTYGKYLD